MATRYWVSQLFDGHQWHGDLILVVDEGQVCAIEPASDDYDYALEGALVPGFIDLQVNGGGGALFNSEPSLEGIATMLRAHAQYGSSAMLPTVITDSLEVMAAAADAVAQARQVNGDAILGIHFEGPHIAPAKKGTHNQQHIRPISEAEWQLYERTDLGQKLVTLAPEAVTSADIRRLTAAGVKVFLGHSNAGIEQAQQALAAGAVGFTHLFNAMSALESRAPGMVGAALLDPHSFCGLIVDGHHVDFQSCKLAVQTRGIHRVALVTDAMPPVGSDQSEFELVGQTVTRQQDRLLGEKGELAGSVLDMAAAVRNAVGNLDVTLEQALTMASATPARALGLQNAYGHLRPGARANMVLMSPDLQVLACWAGGELLADCR